MIYLFVVYRMGVRDISEMHPRLKNHMCDCLGIIVALAPYPIHESML